MQIIKLSNVGRKFHKFINIDDLTASRDMLCGDTSKNGAFWALRNICMAIEEGEIVGVIGRNGSGKTTLLNIISGGLPASEGEVVVEGKISALLTLGAGFQEEFTGRENIYLNATLLGMKRVEIDKVLADIVEFSELGDFINAPIGSYSAGMKMRLGFSVAVYKDFDVLITDEIFTVGDPSFQKKCFEKMMDFKRQGKSMIIATQDMNIIERFCDRVFLLEDGRVFLSDVPSKAIEQYQMLLSKRKILSEGSRSDMITETKRWATDLHEWGRKEGTKEVTIKEVDILTRWGRKTNKIKCGDKIKVRVNFDVHEEIDNFHFGIAIFREDGVYCCGPNTEFDGLAIPRMKKGSGYFELRCGELPLMPGIYYFSAAIWDKNETFAYDYHKCSYKLEITGPSSFGQLLCLANKWSNLQLPVNYNLNYVPNLDELTDKMGSELSSGLAGIDSLTFYNNYGCKDSVFVTGRDFKIKADFKIPDSSKQVFVLWIGIYRSDGIYCHGSIKSIEPSGSGSGVLIYPRMKLLPGGYKASAAIWDPQARVFLAYTYGLNTFNMISDKKDHGTVYLEHHWDWSIPRGG